MPSYDLKRRAIRCLLPVSAVALALPLVMAATDASMVSITLEGDKRVIKSNGLPDHATGSFPNRGNPHTISAQNYIFRMPANPKINSQPTRVPHAYFGVALNGIPFEPSTAEFYQRDPNSGWNYEALSGKINLGVDESMAHVQPTGAYHYHAMPIGLAKRLGDDGKKMVLLGYAGDGFPIYTAYGRTDPNDPHSPLKKMKSGYQLKTGPRPDPPGGDYNGLFTEDYQYKAGTGDLDECNGRFCVTDEYPQGIYCYHITEEFPYISRLFRGTPDQSMQMKGGAGGPGGRGPGKGGPGKGPGGKGPPGKGGPGGGRGPELPDPKAP